MTEMERIYNELKELAFFCVDHTYTHDNKMTDIHAHSEDDLFLIRIVTLTLDEEMYSLRIAPMASFDRWSVSSKDRYFKTAEELIDFLKHSVYCMYKMALAKLTEEYKRLEAGFYP